MGQTGIRNPRSNYIYSIHHCQYELNFGKIKKLKKSNKRIKENSFVELADRKSVV